LSTQKNARILYVYSTSSLAKKDLVRFYYAFKGVLLVPISKVPEIDEFFALWKVPIKKKRATQVYTYTTSKLAKKDLVRFYYALKGRDGKSGVIKATSTEFLAKGVLLVPASKIPEIDEFFALWKVPTKKRRVLLNE
jgi:hypothetical protein